MEVKPGIPAVSVDEELLKELAGEVGEGDTVTVKLTVSSSSSSGSSQPILPFVDVKRTDEWYQATSRFRWSSHGYAGGLPFTR